MFAKPQNTVSIGGSICKRILSLFTHNMMPMDHALTFNSHLIESKRGITHRIGGNLKLLRQSTNADRKRLKIAFSIANGRFRLPD